MVTTWTDSGFQVDWFFRVENGVQIRVDQPIWVNVIRPNGMAEDVQTQHMFKAKRAWILREGGGHPGDVGEMQDGANRIMARQDDACAILGRHGTRGTAAVELICIAGQPPVMRWPDGHEVSARGITW